MGHTSAPSARFDFNFDRIKMVWTYNCFKFPLCGEKCVDKKLHKSECEIFAKLEKKINFSNLDEKHPIYTTIAPLRNVLIHHLMFKKCLYNIRGVLSLSLKTLVKIHVWHVSMVYFCNFLINLLSECSNGGLRKEGRVEVKCCVCSQLNYWVAWGLGSRGISSLHLWQVFLTINIIGGSGDSFPFYILWWCKWLIDFYLASTF